MMRACFFAVVCLAGLLFIVAAPAPLPAQSSGDSVGLGILAGAAFPSGGTENIPSSDWEAGFNWGFFVNIPLIYTFHITPSAELYRFGEQNATDLSIAFKFIVPVSAIDIYFGFVPGVTAVLDVVDIHVGLVGGVSFNAVSNLDLFAQAKYKFLFEGDKNIRVLHLNGGVLFKF